MRLIVVVYGAFNLLFAQIPNGYYTGTQSLYGTALKQVLHNIIKNHRAYEYTSDTTDTWDILKDVDRDSLNTANVIEIYTGWSVNAAQEYNNGNGWEREHVWAKVHGGFDINPPAGTDVHHLRPIDKTINAARNSRWFAECNEPYLVSGAPSGSYYSTSKWVWKPRDQDKGDVARMLFYMAVRYEGENGEPDLELVDYLPTINHDPAPVMAKLSDLLQWHAQDPVDAYERRRNDLIYTKYQHNRNPFVDIPDFAWAIWDAKTATSTRAKTHALQVMAPLEAELWQIESNASQSGTLKVYSSCGKVLFSDDITGVPLQISTLNWPRGIYTIVFNGQAGPEIYRVFK